MGYEKMDVFRFGYLVCLIIFNKLVSKIELGGFFITGIFKVIFKYLIIM